MVVIVEARGVRTVYYLSKMLGLVSCMAVLLAAPVSADEISGSRFNSGPWVGWATTDNTTGEFWYCTINARYSHNSTDLFFYLNRDYTMTLGVSDSLSRFPAGANIPVTLRVDRRSPFYGTATITSESSAFVTLNQMDLALDAMRRGNMLTIEGLYGSLQYQLNGTFRALEEAYNCAARYYNYRGVASAKPEPETGTIWEPSRDQERRMYQLSSAIAADFGIAGITYRDEVAPLLVWDAPDNSMWVGTAIGRLTGGDIDLSFEFGSDMGNLADWCEGDLATVQRQYDASGVATAETYTQCSSEDASTDFTAHIVRQVIADELVEIILFIEAQASERATSRANPQTNLGEAAALISASFQQ